VSSSSTLGIEITLKNETKYFLKES